MEVIKKIIRKGKQNKGNYKVQFYINIGVLLGFVLLIGWILFLYPKTFVDIKIILFLLFLPGIPIALLFNKKILSVCGYKFPIKNKNSYNTTISFLVYLLITIPVGNLLVFTMLLSNYVVADKKSTKINLPINNVATSMGKMSKSSYTHFDIEFEGIKKRINAGNHPITDFKNKVIVINVTKGLFGYYTLRSYKIQDF